MQFESICSPVGGFGLRSSSAATVIFGHEWCVEMWRAAAICVIELMRQLRQRQLLLAAPTSWHVQFVNGQPRYANPGAIAQYSSTRFAKSVRSFVHEFGVPLALAASGQRHLVSAYLRSHWRVPPAVGAESASFHAEHCRSAYPEKGKTLSTLRQSIEAISTSTAEPASMWAAYQRDDMSLTASGEWGYKQTMVSAILERLRPRSVCDLAANAGWYARLAARRGAATVAIDLDDTCVNRMYRAINLAKDEVVPAQFDICSPAPSAGVEPLRMPSALERVRSEMVFALAICHHLVFREPYLSFVQVAHLLAGYSSRWCIAEFVPFGATPANPYTAADRDGSARWYNLGGFVASLKTTFRTVDVIEGPALSRKLILCVK